MSLHVPWFIVYEMPDGRIVTENVVANKQRIGESDDDFKARAVAKLVPPEATHIEIHADDSRFPDRVFRNAWKRKLGPPNKIEIEEDLQEARKIRQMHYLSAGEARLKNIDRRIKIAQANGDSAEVQRLSIARDKVTEIVDVSHMTLDEMKQFRPEVFDDPDFRDEYIDRHDDAIMGKRRGGRPPFPRG